MEAITISTISSLTTIEHYNWLSKEILDTAYNPRPTQTLVYTDESEIVISFVQTI